jgi:hypothetical protein
MNVTTIMAKKAVKKKMVLIDCSLSRDNRAIPAEALLASGLFCKIFPISAS